MIKHIVLSAVLATSAIASTAAYAQTDTKTVTRPDGSSVKIIHRGGQYGDGYYDANNSWVRVSTDADGAKTIDRSDGSQTTVSSDGNTRSTTKADGTNVTTTHTDN